MPRGFLTDFASIPRGLWNLYPPWGQYGRAAVIHDWLYWNQGTTRELADKILKEAMGVCGCDYDTMKAFQTALELFGRYAWDADAASKASGVNPFKDFNNDSAHKSSSI